MIYINIIGMDIGGTSIRTGIIDDDNNISAYKRVPQKEVLTGDSLHSLAEYIKAYINDSGEKNIAALSIGVPAAIDKTRSIVLNAPNVSGLNGLDVKSYLQNALGFPVFLEKDVSMLFFHDMNSFGISPDESAVACYIGTGVGNAIWIDGKLLVGSNGVAGELGHIPVWDSDEICGCGNPGCIESHVGGKYLAKMQKESFPQAEIANIFTEHAEHPALKNYVRHLAIPIATEINILDPVTVVLGGGVISMEDFPREKLVEWIRMYARKPMPEKNLKFIFSCDQGENGITGAAIYARKELEKGDEING